MIAALDTNVLVYFEGMNDAPRQARAIEAVARIGHGRLVVPAQGADLLLSEDLQDGFAWRGVTIVNPFADVPHPLLTALLR